MPTHRSAMSTLFDALPLDVLLKIIHPLANPAPLREAAANLSGLVEFTIARKQQGLAHCFLQGDKQIIALANTSNILRRAILQIFGYRLDVYAWQQGPEIAEMASLFGSDVHHLDTSYYRLFSIPVPTTQHFPGLKSASVNLSHLPAIRGCRDLDKLTVSFHMDTFGYLAADQAVTVLTALPLIELTLRTYAHDQHEAARESAYWVEYEGDSGDNGFCSWSEHPDLKRFSAACSRVEILSLECPSDTVRQLWPMITTLHALKAIELHSAIDEEGIPFLRNLQDVRFLGHMPIRRAAEVGANVTAVTQRERADADTVAKLVTFPKLRRLYVALQDGAESVLIGAVTDVEILELRWSDPALEQFEAWKDKNEYRDVCVGPKAYRDGLYEPDEDVLEEIVKSAPKLRHICLIQASVRADVIEQIFKIAGSRLEHLTVEVEAQRECISLRMALILEAAAMYCSKLCSILFIGLSEYVELDVNFSETEEERRRCLVALERLKDVSPRFNDDQIMRLIVGSVEEDAIESESESESE